MIAIFKNISKSEERFSILIFFDSDSDLISLPEIKGSKSGPKILKQMVVFKLGVYIELFIFAKFYMFFEISFPVDSRLEVEFIIRELDFYFILLSQLLTQVTLSFVIKNCSFFRYRFYFYCFYWIVLMNIIVSQYFWKNYLSEDLRNVPLSMSLAYSSLFLFKFN